ncbi:3-oxoacyl-[acyl-carrier-protein] synthase 2 [Geodia barretti]|uniref:beta-ketoacyl-[acyl-carrier-protein] synthase I n=1 Tax=Geodia barretti TaxID=519541 RepID=A0AA35XJX6_GEOBA|nr:3-oxoacyl-[acyl-carrier-protein] synthase 2 [Geodia barretti]
MVSPLANGVRLSWERLIAGRSGIAQIQGFDPSDLPVKIAGEIPSGDADIVPTKDLRKMDDFIVYALCAAVEAVEDSGWTPEDEESLERTGVMIGSGIGGLKTIEAATILVSQKGYRRLSPFFIPSSLINLASGHVSIRYGFRGPNHSVVTACSTGAHAIGDATHFILRGDADVMVAGGAESPAFAAARALSTNFNDTPERASRPWDEARDGFVMGEGAGVVVLEEYEHAKARDATIYAEIIGYGMSGDAHHVTAPAPDGSGGYRSMAHALRTAELNTDEIDYINAHGTSTPLGDEIELGAVKRLFGEDAGQLSMSSTKSSTGHLLGAAGSVELIFSILAHQPRRGPADAQSR